jgi:hypothetical protein
MIIEIALGLNTLLSLAALIVSIHKRRKPSLAAAVARGVAYAKQVTKPGESEFEHALVSVQQEDMGDNGKRDWDDKTIRKQIEALLHHSPK